MGKAKKKEIRKIPIEIEYTEGYEQRFTEAVLKIYEDTLRKKNDELRSKEQRDNS